MDQYPFEFRFYVAGCQVDDFIKMLEENGYVEQAKCCKIEYENELKNI